jgi:hypothetical protein
MEKYFSIMEFADVCGVNRTTVWRWIKDGKIRTERGAGRELIPKAQDFRRLELANESTQKLSRAARRERARLSAQPPMVLHTTEHLNEESLAVIRLLEVQQEYQQVLKDLLDSALMETEGNQPSTDVWRIIRNNIKALDEWEYSIVELSL